MSTQLRAVICYHCSAAIEVPEQARTTSCPKCYKGLILDDLTVRDASPTGGKLLTCGSVVIMQKARSITRQVTAGGDVQVQGHLEASVESAGTVRLCKRSHLRGPVKAKGLVVEAGAVIDGLFCIGGPIPDSRGGRLVT